MKRVSFCKLISIWMFLLVIIWPVNASAEEKTEILRLNIFERYYKYMMPHFQDFIDITNKKYGIILDVTTVITTDSDSLYYATKNKDIDIIVLSMNNLRSENYPYIANKLVIPIDIEKIPNYQNINPLFQEKPQIMDEGYHYGLPIFAGLHSLAYNADIVNEEPDSWSVLWDKDNAKKYSICSNYPEGNIFITALALGSKAQDLSDYNSLIHQIPLNTLRTKLNQLTSNVYSYYPVYPSLGEMKHLSYTTTWGLRVLEAQKQGMNWKTVYPKEGCKGWLDILAITSAVTPNSRKYDICLDFFNYFLRNELQVKCTENGDLIPVTYNATTHDSSQYSFSEDYFVSAFHSEEIETDTMRLIDALWKYAMTQKSTSIIFKDKYEDSEIMGTEGDDNDLDFIHAGSYYKRGKKIAEERRRIRSQKASALPITLPIDLKLLLVEHSIKTGYTKQEIIIKALEEYMAKYALVKQAPAK